MSKKLEMANKLVDVVLDKPSLYKKMKSYVEATESVDTILDDLDNKIDHVPDQLSGVDQVKDVQDEVGKDESQKEMEK